MRRFGAAAVAAAVWCLAGASLVSAAPSVSIDFQRDRERPIPNGTSSVDSASVTFGDSRGEDLEIGDFGHQSHGKALGVWGDDPSALIIDVRRPARSISLWFGNDDPGWTRPGDRAVLTLFHHGRRVGRVSVKMNRNDRMDQWIAYEGHPFDRAVFLFDADRRRGLIEIVDDITISPLAR